MSYEFEFMNCEFKSTSYEFESMSYEFESTSYEFESTSYEFKSTSYEFESTSYEFESTSYEFESTSSRIIKNSMKTQVNRVLKSSSFPKIISPKLSPQESHPLPLFNTKLCAVPLNWLSVILPFLIADEVLRKCKGELL